MRQIAIAFALASASCSSCREDARPPPLTTIDASPSPSASTSTAPSASASVSSSVPLSQPSKSWELVAKRKASDRQLWIADVGTRVIVGDRTPLAWADESGPLVASPRIETGAERFISNVAGTFPGVFITTDKRIYRLLGNAWKDEGPLPPKTRDLVPFGAHGAVLVASAIEGNSMPTILKDDLPATTLQPFVEQGEHLPVLAIEPGFGAFDASGTRDGHLWLLGFRAGRQGMWVAHVKEGEKTGYQLYPGSERCDDAGFGIYVYRSRIIGIAGERAFLFVVNDAAECMGPIGTYLYERSEKGFAGIPLPKNASESMGTTVIGSARDGTLYFTMLDGTPYRRDADGKTTKLDAPKDCGITQIAQRADGDTWMIARCDGADVVYRRGHAQAALDL